MLIQVFSLAPPTPQPNEKVPRIERNKYGQRIDPPFVYDKDAFKRMRQLHLCQNHFLRECQYGNDWYVLICPIPLSKLLCSMRTYHLTMEKT